MEVIAAAHLDNFLFLLFVAIWLFFQVLTRAAGKGRRSGGDKNKTTTPPRPIPRPARELPEETDQDRIRKFLEALGQPTSSRPPSPVSPRTDIPPLPVAPIKPAQTFPTRGLTPRQQWKRMVVLQGPQPIPLPTLTTRPPDLPPTEVTVPPQVMPKTQRRVFQPRSELPAFEVHAGPPPITPIMGAEVAGTAQAATATKVSKSVESNVDLRSLLRTPSGLRDAIILREIFGPPRSMQPLDLVGNG